MGTKRINPLKYYIVDFSDFTDPRLLRFGFKYYREARSYINRFITNTDTVEVIGGLRAKRRNLKFFNHNKSPHAIRPKKYNYPPEADTRKARKNFRDKLRYWKAGEFKPKDPETQKNLKKFYNNF